MIFRCRVGKFRRIYCIKKPGLEGIWPLLPLSKDGAQRAVVEEMITGLQTAHREDLFALAYAFAALVFEQPDDRQWLHRRFEMLHDILEESWAYQEIKQKGLAEGIQQGRDEERQEARLRELQHHRQMLTTYIETHFPDMVPLVKVQTYDIDDPEVLQRLLIDLFRVQSDEEVERTIMSVSQQME